MSQKEKKSRVDDYLKDGVDCISEAMQSLKAAMKIEPELKPDLDRTLAQLLETRGGVVGMKERRRIEKERSEKLIARGTLDGI